MAMSLMGETIDIHAGGVDLMFPHHENEIAQSEGCTGKAFARFWMHNGFLNIDGAKMAKSAGNFLKIDQVLGRHPVEAIRAFMMSAHYRSPLDYTEEALVEAGAATRRINDGIETAQKMLGLLGAGIDATWREAGLAEATEIWSRFEQAMDDDFNTPRALAALHDAVTAIFETIKKRPIQAARLAALCGLAVELRDFFSLESSAAVMGTEPAEPPIKDLLEKIRSEAVSAGVETPGTGAGAGADGLTVEAAMAELIETRRAARKMKVFALADGIRARLGECGYALEDYPEGTIWKRSG